MDWASSTIASARTGSDVDNLTVQAFLFICIRTVFPQVQQQSFVCLCGCFGLSSYFSVIAIVFLFMEIGFLLNK